ncbi:spore germination protein GerPC [Paenibacillus allorhizosphaerae]|uniref:spore germination protein GerPC n=1 Tax=Paenibacillus allorhizosphaerae TaxID=2849866 RepID=UPI001C4050F0|nr:spore germination protein GerPC [Paenibacillus allorhizosphaerae]
MFWKKKTVPDTSVRDLERQLRDLNAQFRRLEESLERLSAKAPQITIENIHIHQPVVEKMEYRLDALDIEHLSGSLNLGNNFGGKTPPGPGPSTMPLTKKKDETVPAGGSATTNAAADRPPSGHSEAGLQSTPTGFRLKRS